MSSAPPECQATIILPAQRQKELPLGGRAARPPTTITLPAHLRWLETKRQIAPKRPKRDHYDPASFRRAVKRLCTTTNVPNWTPNRLRHNAATRFRKEFGIEVARVLLGHRRLNTTEVYAERDVGKAMRAARDLG